MRQLPLQTRLQGPGTLCRTQCRHLEENRGLTLTRHASAGSRRRGRCRPRCGNRSRGYCLCGISLWCLGNGWALDNGSRLLVRLAIGIFCQPVLRVDGLDLDPAGAAFEDIEPGRSRIGEVDFSVVVERTTIIDPDDD